MKKIQKLITLLLALSLIFLAACSNETAESSNASQTNGSGSTDSDSSNSGSSNFEDAKVREIKVAAAPGWYPITFADDNGEADGYDVAVFKELDKLLEEYTFVYELAEKETMNVGVQTGTYQVGINSLFKTEEREETYLLTENVMGYTAVGIIHKAEDTINDFQDVYDQGLTIYPLQASTGFPHVIESWNEENPNAQLNAELVSTVSLTDALTAVRAGEYDVTVYLIPVYDLLDEEATAGLTISDPVDVLPTYPIINKNETKLAAAIDEGLKTLRENGTLSKLSEEYFGYDVFSIK